MTKYAIVRMEFPNPFSYTKMVRHGLTLEEAQEHCQREDTREEGEWFDAFMKHEDLHPDDQEEIALLNDPAFD